jgi:hypothetical protein
MPAWLIVSLLVWLAGWAFTFGFLMVVETVFSPLNGREPRPGLAAVYSAFWPFLLLASVFG